MKKFIKAFLILLSINVMMHSCGQSAEDKAKAQVAKDLGLDKSDLDSKSYYTISIKDGALQGQEFSVPNYASTYDGFRADENQNVTMTSVTFVDPEQGNSVASIHWDGTKTKPLNADQMSTEGSFLEFKIKKDVTTYHFTSISGTTEVNSYKDVKVKDEMIDHVFTKRDVNMGFDGLFLEINSGEEVRIEGTIQFKNPQS